MERRYALCHRYNNDFSKSEKEARRDHSSDTSRPVQQAPERRDELTRTAPNRPRETEDGFVICSEFELTLDDDWNQTLQIDSVDYMKDAIDSLSVSDIYLDTLIICEYNPLSKQRSQQPHENSDTPDHFVCANSLVLSSKCPYFKTYFAHGWAESTVSPYDLSLYHPNKHHHSHDHVKHYQHVPHAHAASQGRPFRYVFIKPNVSAPVMNAIVAYCRNSSMAQPIASTLGITPEIALPVLQAADEMMMDDLCRLVYIYILDNVMSDYAAIMLRLLPEIYNKYVNSLRLECQKYVTRNMCDLIDNAESLRELDDRSVLRLLSDRDNTYHTSELWVWECFLEWAVLKWSCSLNSQTAKEPSASLRSFLRPFIEQGCIKLLNLTTEEFAKGIESYGLVDAKYALLKYRFDSMVNVDMQSRLLAEHGLWERFASSRPIVWESEHPHRMDVSPKAPLQVDIDMPNWCSRILVEIDSRSKLCSGAQLGFFAERVNMANMELIEVFSSRTKGFRMHCASTKWVIFDEPSISVLFVSYKRERGLETEDEQADDDNQAIDGDVSILAGDGEDHTDNEIAKKKKRRKRKERNPEWGFRLLFYPIL